MFDNIRTLTLLIALSTFMPVMSWADEHTVLKRVLSELDAMRPLIAEAQRVTDHQARLRFDYACLIGDYNLIKSGVREAAYRVRAHAYQSLCADYGNSSQLGEQAKYLQLLTHELMNLHVLLDEAQQQADSRSRERVNYPALNADIDTVVAAIQQAIISAGEQPRPIPVLRGGYSQ